MTDERLTRDGTQRLHQAMTARVAAGELPGLVTVLAAGDEVHVDAIGHHGFGDPTPMQRSTPFRIASLTKPMLAVVTMRLAEAGRLRLEDPVERWLPELAKPRVLRRIDGPLEDTVPAQRSITVEDLLTSRMGTGVLTEPTFNPPFPIVTAAEQRRLVLAQPDPRTPHPPEEWMRRFGELPLMSQPGSDWRYNASFLVLGVLVARAGGASLAEVMSAELFNPLGMHDTGFWATPEQAERLPGYYLTDPENGKLALQAVSTAQEWSRPPVFESGAGGLLSTADDLLAFARLLRDQGVHAGRQHLSGRSVELLTRNHLTQEQIAGGGSILDSRGWGYGLGVELASDELPGSAGRYGWEGGYGTTWYNDPQRDLIAIALTQTTDFLFNGGREEFLTLSLRAVQP